MDVQKEIQTRMQSYIESEKFEDKMNEIVEKTVNDSIASLFSYGELNKAVNEMFKERLSINAQNMNFDAANEIISRLVLEKTVAAFQEPLRKKLAKELDELFQPAPDAITVQGLLDIIREDVKDDSCHCHTERLTVALDQTDHGGWYLKIWVGERYTSSAMTSIYGGNKRENETILHLYVSDDTKTIRIIHNLDVMKGLGTALFGFRAKLFQMYCKGTVITDIATVEPDYLETSINGNEY